METPDAKEVLSKYARLQSSLCNRLVKEFDITDDSGTAFALPKSGSLTLTNEVWSFTRHGKGARLIRNSDGCVVDASDLIVSCSSGFDAWRLVDHFASIKLDLLKSDGEVFNVSAKEAISCLLETLDRRGEITLVDRGKGVYALI